ncbi:N-acetylglucosamine-6-phosphate deacetylase [Corynebacterium lowii]|uniref:N-acetylglucosamine-6-phosphate deacetylase n=1 Tax=Corynebacterium lowii TaxID=1544413 RepID=A0A0Q0UED4_9CORY|nr:amidohydrolase family protein [Corynebacterium lowii]KQB86217.1 N-acetylglucosamine-6-phosphate deacetylase [Corynebacterium lowii]MDP9852691.1 N-acetylglucosamine-6-phosphate deacetylase [Corynebacterium lowii]
MTQPAGLVGRIITAEREYPHARLRWDNGCVESIEELSGPAPRDCPTVIPGLVDVHNHGGAGGAFPTGSKQECLRAARFHRSQGTTTMLASLVSGHEEELRRQIILLREMVEQGEIYGIHLEGPFINSARCGAQAPSRIQPGDPAMLRRLIAEAAGTIRQVTLAPETDHAAELMDICAAHGVIVSFGHTDAPYEVVREAIAQARGKGATVTATHLFNGMAPLHHRAPGASAALLEAAARGEAWVEVIADGVHLHEGTVDMVTAAAPERTLAVTDAMEAAGMSDGTYELGPLTVEVSGGVARLESTGAEPGAIAGGTSTLLQQFLSYRERHGAVAAVRFTSTHAARVLGLEDRAGDLRPGMPATFVVLDESEGIATQVWCEGRRSV